MELLPLFLCLCVASLLIMGWYRGLVLVAILLTLMEACAVGVALMVNPPSWPLIGLCAVIVGGIIWAPVSQRA